MGPFLPLLFSGISLASAAEHNFHVDCNKGDDRNRGTSALAPFRTVHAAQKAIRVVRGESGSVSAAVVSVTGRCELQTTLALGPADSNTRYVAAGSGAMLSGGTAIAITDVPSTSVPLTVDLAAHGFTSARDLGELRGRGYSGGSACIEVNVFEPSAAELFYRPDGPSSVAGARAYGPSEASSGRMRLARFPNAAPDVPARADWASIDSVDTSSLTLTVGAFTARLDKWRAEIESGTHDAWTHGLWTWNWADRCPLEMCARACARVSTLVHVCVFPCMCFMYVPGNEVHRLLLHAWVCLYTLVRTCVRAHARTRTCTCTYSHRRIKSIHNASGIVVEPDDINRDVNPIHRHVARQQGGYL